VTYIDHENPFSSADGAYGAPHAAALSPNAWVGCGGDIYVLECLGHGFIRVEPASPGTSATNGKSVDAPAAYVAHYTPVAPDHQTAQSFKLSPFRRSRPVLTAASLADALHGCDTYATTRVVFGPQAVGCVLFISSYWCQNIDNSHKSLKRTAKWRSEPATPAQRKLVAAKWKVSSQQLKPEERAARIAALTKGEAGNIITKLKHGAQVCRTTATSD
jgi:ATP-dependent helicase IRC3